MTTRKKNGNGGHGQLALREGQEPSVALMLQKVIDKGITTENVAALESLVGLYERMQSKQAEQQYNLAFNKLQAETPKIEPTAAVPNKDGTLRYRYAPFEQMMDKIQPVLTANGFAISFTSRYEADRMIVVCILRHVGGHSQTNEFAVRIGGGPPGATVTQADGSAKTYAKRGALCDALNIVIEHDDDARGMGSKIGRAIAEEFQKRVRDCGCDEQAFLRYAGVSNAKDPATIEDYMEICDTPDDENYTRLDEALRRKEKAAAKTNGPRSQEPRNARGEFSW